MALNKPMPRPKRTDKNNEIVSSAEKGTKPGEARKTYILPMDLIEKMGEIAYIERKFEKETVTEALQKYVDSYEKKHGAIQLRAKR